MAIVGEPQRDVARVTAAQSGPDAAIASTIARYQLWHGVGTRSLRVRWLAEELGIANSFDVHEVRFPARLHAPDYLNTNPLGSLPYFVDGGTRMSESIAICQYLVARHAPTPLALQPDEPGYGAYLNFSIAGEASLMPPVGGMVRYHLIDGPEHRSTTALAEARAAFQHRLHGVEEALAGGAPFLAGGRLTLADISVGYTLGLVDLLGEGDLLSASLKDYLDRLRQRPAWIRAASPVVPHPVSA